MFIKKIIKTTSIEVVFCFIEKIDTFRVVRFIVEELEDLSVFF